MKPSKKKKLEDAGWKVGSADELLGSGKKKARGKRRAKTKAVVKRRSKMVKCVYQEGRDGYYTKTPGRLRKSNTACSCEMCKAGRKQGNPVKYPKKLKTW